MSPHLPGGAELHPVGEKKLGAGLRRGEFSPFPLGTHTLGPPATSPGLARVLGSEKLISRLPPARHQGSGTLLRPHQGVQRPGQDQRKPPGAAGHPRLQQIFLEHLPMPGAARGSANSPANEPEPWAAELP